MKDPPREEQKAGAEAEKPADEQAAPKEEDAKASSDNSDKSKESEEGAEGEAKDGKKKEPPPPPPPHGDKSPWQVFRETFQTELKQSKDWNESTKALSEGAQSFAESERVRAARAAYESASSKTSSATSAALKNTGQAIGKGAAWTWDSTVVKGIRKGAGVAGKGIDVATKPIRDSEAFKSVSKAMDDGASSRYGGWTEKEERRKARELRDAEDIRLGRRRAAPMEEDPEAGTNVTLHKDAKWKESWREFKDNNRMAQSVFSMRKTYEESENPLIETARSITDRIAGFFAENETALVIKKFREMDPSFQVEPFLRDMREYILPEVLDAYVKGDLETLRQWLSAAQFQVYSALADQWTKAGMRVDGKIVDIRNVDIMQARMLDPGDVPVFIITARTQEVHVYRKLKTGELAAGMEDKVQQVTYAIGVTRLPDEVANPETRGWRLIELHKSARDYY